ncbi:DMT family transporter [Aneurinibacillus tyrosinisolvens]|uniref:DMT family transporter n=1 Tax=Aneurinibacillus tyrosinisolvens TaxID=1443435 RepID=UPI00063EFC65|nr:DMT family transporter [Aneurinibacillus tyrosinisolvens]
MGILFAVVCAITYSSNYILIQLGMKKSKKDNGDFLSLLSCVLTILVVFLLMAAFQEPKRIPFSGKGILFYLIAGFSTAFLGRVLLFGGIRRIGSPRAAGIKNSAPVFTIFIAVALMGERISFGAGIGISIIFLALFLQARHDFRQANQIDEKEKKHGILLAIIAAVCFGIGQAARKQGIIYYADPILGSLIGSVFALFAFMIMELSKKRLRETLIRNFRSLNLYFVGAGIFTGIAQLSFFASLLYTHVSYTSAVAAMEPIITVILSKIFLRKEERITIRLGITACAVFFGAFILISTK